MELKVWVDNIQRIVCGVSDTTTCQDVVYALAHATSQTGRFTLLEKWRNNERVLSPNDKPLKVLLKWGEYACDVQFVLRRSKSSSNESHHEEKEIKSPYFSPQHKLNDSGASSKSPLQIVGNNKEIKKSLTFSGGRSSANTPCDFANSPVSERNEVPSIQNSRIDPPPLHKDHRIRHDVPKGVVRGVPQQRQPNGQLDIKENDKSPETIINRGNKKIGPPPEYRIPPPCQQYRSSPKETRERTFSDGKNQFGSPSDNIRTMSPVSYSHNVSSAEVSNGNPVIVSDGKDYDHYAKEHNERSFESKPHALHQNGNKKYPPMPPERTQASHDTVYKRAQNDSHYLELLHIVNSQRDKLFSLDSDLKKYDSEIKILEESNKKQEQQSQFLNHEIKKLELTELEHAENIFMLDQQELDNKYENGVKHEQSLRNEIQKIRADFKNSEKEVTAYEEKLHLLVYAIKKQKEEMNEETKLAELKEMETQNEINNIRRRIDLELDSYTENTKSSEEIEKEMHDLGENLENKQKEMDDLVSDMKDVNLESLILGSTEETKTDGQNHSRSGSARKILGSPRELENAVPTSKNPHGVWV